MSALTIALAVTVIAFAAFIGYQRNQLADLEMRWAKQLITSHKLRDQLRDYQQRFGTVIRHDEKFADMPRVTKGPIAVPEGHPEFGGGA